MCRWGRHKRVVERKKNEFSRYFPRGIPPILSEMSMVSGVTVLLRIVSPLPLFCYPSGTWSDGLCVISASSGLHFSAVDATRGSKMAKKGKNLPVRENMQRRGKCRDGPRETGLSRLGLKADMMGVRVTSRAYGLAAQYIE